MSSNSISQNLAAGARQMKLGDHVGFDSLPDQLVNKAVNQGFDFNILCVGETGIGKSTLMDTLFNTSFDTVPSSHDLPGVRLNTNTYELRESTVNLKLTVVNTEGYGDQINKDNSWAGIAQYIEAQFESYMQEELKIKRSLYNYHDTRLHVCLYFIAPTGHSLKALDLDVMKNLGSKVNIVPIIAKADTITRAELQLFKNKVLAELRQNEVQIYQFPTEDETVSTLNAEMNLQLPFAVVGSTEEVKVGNKTVRARQYPWGIVQVENENHCDFVKLREMLLRTNLEDLRTRTHTQHYELYRRSRLQQMGFQDSPEYSVSETYARKRAEHEAHLQRSEDDMRQSFVTRVKDKEAELKEQEKELHVRFETLKQTQAEERQRLENERQQLELEMAEFTKRKEQAMSTLKKKK